MLIFCLIVGLDITTVILVHELNNQLNELNLYICINFESSLAQAWWQNLVPDITVLCDRYLLLAFPAYQIVHYLYY